jgi:AAA15 family ATPase/GTPase
VSWFLANSIKKQTENTKEQMSTDELERFKKGVETIWADNTLTDEQKRAALSVLSSKFNKSAFINIVEEPEQNLFPTSQRHILNSLLEFGQMNNGNMLVITTHSPYIINYLTLAVKAHYVVVKANTSSKKEALQAEVSEIVPLVSTLNSDDLIIYELDDKGSIIKLGNYKGLPSDDNYLNDKLGETNDLIANLLEIEDRCL